MRLMSSKTLNSYIAGKLQADSLSPDSGIQQAISFTEVTAFGLR